MADHQAMSRSRLNAPALSVVASAVAIAIAVMCACLPGPGPLEASTTSSSPPTGAPGTSPPDTTAPPPEPTEECLDALPPVISAVEANEHDEGRFTITVHLADDCGMLTDAAAFLITHGDASSTTITWSPETPRILTKTHVSIDVQESETGTVEVTARDQAGRSSQERIVIDHAVSGARFSRESEAVWRTVFDDTCAAGTHQGSCD